SNADLVDLQDVGPALGDERLERSARCDELELTRLFRGARGGEIELVRQADALDLPCRPARDLLDEQNSTRNLEVRQSRRDGGADVVLRERGPGTQHDRGSDLLAETRIGNGERYG